MFKRLNTVGYKRKCNKNDIDIYTKYLKDKLLVNNIPVFYLLSNIEMSFSIIKIMTSE